MLRVVQLGVLLDPQRSPSQMMNDWWAMVDTAEMVARAGAEVVVVQASRVAETVQQREVTYHFLVPQAGRTLCGSGRFAQLLAKLTPDVVHVHGLGFAQELLDLAQCLPDTPILVQDHADGVPGIWRRRRHRRALAAVSGLAFCALGQAEPFRRSGMIAPGTRLFEIPECSSRFTPGDQDGARGITGMAGDPAVLWVGRLNANKDPLTVLDGVSRVMEQLPGLELWCCFGQAPLRAEVERRMAADSRLRGHVHLLGSVPHGRVEQLMRAADLFVLGSHHEGSGFSVIEALACGLPPVITDIPSFDALTAHGAVGALWRCEDASALAEALLRAAAWPRAAARAAARAHFDRELSCDAVGRKFVAAYQALRSDTALRGR